MLKVFVIELITRMHEGQTILLHADIDELGKIARKCMWRESVSRKNQDGD